MAPYLHKSCLEDTGVSDDDFINLSMEVNSMSDRQVLILLLGEQRHTNAHMAKLNGSVKDLMKWRYIMTGGLVVVSLVVLPLLLDFIGAHIK